jgi:hypothetical protein
MLGRGGPQQLTFPEPIPCSHASGKPSSRSATLEPQKLTAKNETPPRTGEEFMRWHRGMCPIPARKSPAVARGLESRGSTLTSSLVPGWCGYSMASQDENPARAALSRLKAGSREPPWLELRYMRAPLRQHAGCARGSCDPPTVAVVPFRAGARFQKGRRRLRSPRLFWRKAHSRTPSPNDDSRRADCVAGHLGLELRNVVANYRFEKPHRFPEIQPNSGHGGPFAFELPRRGYAARA